MRRGHEQKRVAVRRRARDRLQGKIAAAARPVFDDDRLAEPLRQPLADQARDDVGRAAGADENHNGDGAGRIGLRAAGTWQGGQCAAGGRELQKSTAMNGHDALP